MKSRTCIGIASTLLIDATCNARTLRKNSEGFDVVGSGQVYQGELPNDVRRSLLSQASDYEDKEFEVKEYVNDESLEYVDAEGNINGRRDASCQSNEKVFTLDFKTDAYGYETSYTLEKRVGNDVWETVEYGPKNNQKFEDNTSYTGTPICLAGANTYRLIFNDAQQDGLCCSYGKGGYAYSIDGVVQYDTDFKSTFDDKAVHQFTVGLPYSGRDNSSLCGGDEQQIRIELKVDAFGKENSWELRNIDTNQVVRQAAEGKYGANDEDDVAVCVPDGKYRFTMWDGVGDG